MRRTGGNKLTPADLMAEQTLERIMTDWRMTTEERNNPVARRVVSRSLTYRAALLHAQVDELWGQIIRSLPRTVRKLFRP